MEPTATTEQAEATAGGNGSAPASETFEVRRPTDGTLIREVPIDSAERVAEVVARVRANQAEWEALGFEGRYRWLAKWRDWIFANADRLADVMQAETGKVRADAEIEAPFITDAINFWGKRAAGYLADETPAAPNPMFKVKKLRITYRPYPVVGVISPWNFPFILAFDDAIPAMMAGAAIVIKPSEVTPLIANEVVKGWKEIGAPDILDVVNGAGDTGGALVDEVDFLQFTGSERTGKIVMKRAADTLTPVSLELGGKDPMIVLRDANLERAVNAAAYGGLANTGQICMAIERVYVEEPIYDEFVARLTEKVGELRQGADQGRAYQNDVGAMTFPPQVDIVSEHVEDARGKGARITTGGKRGEGPGNWYEPTVVADADHSMKVMVDETFGPVLGVMKVADAEEAIKMANDTRYGLSASVMSKDTSRAEEVARRLEVGATNIDDVLTNYFLHNLPMGGWKSSGVGFRHGAYGIKRFCRSEAIVSPRFAQGKRDPLWFPHKRSERRLVNGIFRFINARGLKNRLGLGKRG